MKRINLGGFKKGLKLVGVGFILGLIYSNAFIYSDLIKEAAAKENIKEEEIVEKEENKAPEPKECVLDSVSCKIKEVADEYNIDWKMAVAISKHETGNYTSYAFKSLNNVGGMMYWDGTKSALQSFKSLDEGIEKYIRNLKYNYYDKGLTTFKTIQQKYAPIGADNDDRNLNQYWVKGVTKYYNLLDE